MPRRGLSALGIRREKAAITDWMVALFAVIQVSHGLGVNAADARTVALKGVSDEVEGHTLLWR